jgi:hypothetical protein
MTAVAAGTGTIVAGQEITGTGIPFGTTIDKYVSGTNTITMSAAATASGSGVAIVGISDVYVYAKATVSNGIGNQIGMTEAAGNLVKEFGNYGTAAGARFQAGSSAAGTFAFRFFGLRAGGPGLALTSANQAQTQGRIRARTAVTGNYSVALTDDILAVTNSDTTSDTITLPDRVLGGRRRDVHDHRREGRRLRPRDRAAGQRRGDDHQLGRCRQHEVAHHELRRVDGLLERLDVGPDTAPVMPALVAGLREQHRRLSWLAAELYYGVQAVLEDWRQWREDCRQINEEHDRYVAEHRE